jgi:hypothetical protein
MDLYPLLDRDRYNDDEWALASAGLCDWVIEYGMYPGRVVHCGQPADPGSFYRWCTDHDEQALDENPGAYGQ